MLSRLYPSGTQPNLGTRPHVTLSPVWPLAAAGARTDPPVSVPSPPSTSPAATAMPVPALDPAAECSTFHGFLGMGKPFSGSGAPQANSLVTVLPMMTAPAARSRSTTGASQWAPQDRSRMWLLAVV